LISLVYHLCRDWLLELLFVTDSLMTLAASWLVLAMRHFIFVELFQLRIVAV